MLAAAAKSLQSCPTLCNPIDGTHQAPVPGILQARTLEWVAISFSSAGKWKVKVKSLSHVQLFVTPWAVAHQAPPSMGFPRRVLEWGAIAFSIFHVHLKVYSSAFGWNVLKISVRSISSNVSFDLRFLINFLFWWYVHWCEWGVKVSYYYCVIVSFSFYVH